MGVDGECRFPPGVSEILYREAMRGYLVMPSAWRFAEDPQVGAWWFDGSGDGRAIAATPFWDGEESILVEVYHGGRYQPDRTRVVSLECTGDPELDAWAYATAMNRVVGLPGFVFGVQ